MTWDCAVGTPDEDHDWKYNPGEPDVGIGPSLICRQCGKVIYAPDDYVPDYGNDDE